MDEHEVVFESHYLDWDMQEYTRLIDQDRFRSRAIYSWQNGDLSRSLNTTMKHVWRMSSAPPQLIEDGLHSVLKQVVRPSSNAPPWLHS